MELMIADKMREVTKITPHQLKELLPDARPLLIYGKSGRGKSAIIAQYAKDAGKKLKIFNLAMEMPEAMGGIPYVDLTDEDKAKVKEYFVKLMNRELKEIFECKGKDWVIFFDEVNQGVAEVFNTMYSIWHPDPKARNWAGHSLEFAQIVAAGNLDDGTDGTVYLNALPTPLHNRVHIFELVDSKEDTKAYLKEKWKNIPQVAKYIDVLLNEEIPPRDIDECLDILSYNQNSLWIESKLGSALTAKIYDIQKKIKSVDPATTLRLCREGYAKFQEEGMMKWAGEILETEEEVLNAFRTVLSEEEVQSIVKGVE